MSHPRTGGRVVLTRVTVEEERVVYRAELFLPAVVHLGEVAVAARDGAVSFGPWSPPDPPAWMIAFAQAFLRSEWRARQAATDPPPWPARISRWRDEKKGGTVP
jgi:hypothetical protein